VLRRARPSDGRSDRSLVCGAMLDRTWRTGPLDAGALPKGGRGGEAADFLRGTLELEATASEVQDAALHRSPPDRLRKRVEGTRRPPELARLHPIFDVCILAHMFHVKCVAPGRIFLSQHALRVTAGCGVLGVLLVPGTAIAQDPAIPTAASTRRAGAVLHRQRWRSSQQGSRARTACPGAPGPRPVRQFRLHGRTLRERRAVRRRECRREQTVEYNCPRVARREEPHVTLSGVIAGSVDSSELALRSCSRSLV
jgi:hypothetical protein